MSLSLSEILLAFDVMTDSLDGYGWMTEESEVKTINFMLRS